MKRIERKELTKKMMEHLAEVTESNYAYTQFEHCDNARAFIDMTSIVDRRIRQAKKALKIAIVEEGGSEVFEEIRGRFELFGSRIERWQEIDGDVKSEYLYKVGFYDERLELVHVLQIKNGEVTKLLSDEEFGAVTDLALKDYDYMIKMGKLMVDSLEKIE